MLSVLILIRIIELCIVVVHNNRKRVDYHIDSTSEQIQTDIIIHEDKGNHSVSITTSEVCSLVLFCLSSVELYDSLFG